MDPDAAIRLTGGDQVAARRSVLAGPLAEQGLHDVQTLGTTFGTLSGRRLMTAR